MLNGGLQKEGGESISNESHVEWSGDTSSSNSTTFAFTV